MRCPYLLHDQSYGQSYDQNDYLCAVVLRRLSRALLYVNNYLEFMQMLRILPALMLAALALSSCRQSGQSENKEAAQPEPMQGFMVTLECRELQGPDSETPQAEVFLRIANEATLLDTISTCQRIEPASYEQYGMPAQTVSACGGWWAGGGDYFYTIIDGDQLLVMKGWQDEGQTDEGFHYEEVKRIALAEVQPK